VSRAGSKAIAIVLGRAGSVGVPGKNMALVANKPCAQWTIEAALDSERVGAVVVSSDDPALRRLGSRLGARAFDRSAELASSTARVDDAAREALKQFEKELGRPLADDAPVAILYASVPIRPAGLIDRAIETLQASRADSVQSFADVGKHHPWWTVRIAADGAPVEPWSGDVLFHNCFRRQDLPPAMVPDGGVMVMTRRALMLDLDAALIGPHAFLGRDRRGVLTRLGEVVDIDAQIDLLVADAMLRERATATSGAAR
jgi:CMP-N,N'-diacetyllegionaminic acid synthase